MEKIQCIAVIIGFSAISRTCSEFVPAGFFCTGRSAEKPFVCGDRCQDNPIPEARNSINRITLLKTGQSGCCRMYPARFRQPRVILRLPLLPARQASCRRNNRSYQVAGYFRHHPGHCKIGSRCFSREFMSIPWRSPVLFQSCEVNMPASLKKN